MDRKDKLFVLKVLDDATAYLDTLQLGMIQDASSLLRSLAKATAMVENDVELRVDDEYINRQLELDFEDDYGHTDCSG